MRIAAFAWLVLAFVVGCKVQAPTGAALRATAQDPPAPSQPASTGPRPIFALDELGPNKPPRGRSLFDVMTVEASPDGVKQVVPWPFEKLIERLATFAPADEQMRPVTGVLLPRGRSIQKDFVNAKNPRVVIAVTGGVRKETDKLGADLRGLLFVGYAKERKALEVISFNPAAGRFEFQVVEDYDDKGKREVAYADRALCLSCHQNQGPIFSMAPWSETNTNEEVRRILAAGDPSEPNRKSYSGIEIAPQALARQGIGADIEGSVRAGHEVLEAGQFYQQFSPDCPSKMKPEDCKKLTDTAGSGIRLRGWLHEAAIRSRCGTGSAEFLLPPFDALVKLRSGFLEGTYPRGAISLEPTIPDPTTRTDAGAPLTEAQLNPLSQMQTARPYSFQTEENEYMTNNIDRFLGVLSRLYAPVCEHLPKALREDDDKLHQALTTLAASAEQGRSEAFRVSGFAINLVVNELRALANEKPLPNFEASADALPIKVVERKPLPAGALANEPSPKLFEQFCSRCHGPNGQMPLFEEPGHAGIEKAIAAPELAREIYKRLNWEATPAPASPMPPRRSEERKQLERTSLRAQMLRMVEKAAGN